MEIQILSPEAPAKSSRNKNQDAMDVDGGEVQLVMPGETITSDLQFMRCVTVYVTNKPSQDWISNLLAEVTEHISTQTAQ